MSVTVVHIICVEAVFLETNEAFWMHCIAGVWHGIERDKWMQAKFEQFSGLLLARLFN